ncbi:hypothetical protein [Hyalangium gracile]|uniref:hypothetical protein n=1 Tax=Hyalangium gracile TaxID=394092 RepID=UPI001CCF8FFB|nr:hypothetical protein [Hyalangium gracile]
MRLRTFPPQVEQLAQLWRAQVLTTSSWVQVGEPIPGAESEPFFVRSTDGFSGLAKPGTSQPPVHRHPRAAHEKIAADLAYELGLPVPPVILWRSGRPGMSISALAFPRALPWGAIPPSMGGQLLPRLAPVASAMAAFDSWLANTDRQNDGNLLLSEDDTVTPPVLRVAYLDFANSMTYRWAQNQRWQLDDAVACYPDRIPVDETSLRATLQEIEQFPRTTIEEIVTRIPEDFLSVAHRTTILDGLLHRQSRVRGMMATVYPGIP